jgi:hypothetical protein
MLSAAGLIPVIRQYSGERTDRFNRRRIYMSDGSGDEVVLTAPNQLMMLNLPPYNVPQVIVQDAFLAQSLQLARFEVVDDSEWAELWHGVGLIRSWLTRNADSAISSSESDSNPEDSLSGDNSSNKIAAGENSDDL